jgi:hypothetical protein
MGKTQETLVFAGKNHGFCWIFFSINPLIVDKLAANIRRIGWEHQQHSHLYQHKKNKPWFQLMFQPLFSQAFPKVFPKFQHVRWPTFVRATIARLN